MYSRVQNRGIVPNKRIGGNFFEICQVNKKSGDIFFISNKQPVCKMELQSIHVEKSNAVETFA